MTSRKLAGQHVRGSARQVGARRRWLGVTRYRDRRTSTTASVVVADINSGAAEAVAARIGGRAFEVDLAADFEAAALDGHADVLVNCAGIAACRPGPRVPAR